MKRRTSAWGRPHAQASIRLGRKTLAFLLSLVICLSLLPGAAMAGDADVTEEYGLWLCGKKITSENADSYVRYTLREPGNPKAGGTLYIEQERAFSDDYTNPENGIAATIYAKYPLTIQLNAGLTVKRESSTSTADIYCEDTLTVQGNINTAGNQDYDLFAWGSVSAKSVTLKYARLRSNAGSVTARDGNITLTGSCLMAWHGAFTDNTCVSAANGAIIAENAKIGDKTECYTGETQQEGFVSGETNCLKNETLVAELDNSLEQVETPLIASYNTIDGVKFVGTQQVYLFCDTADAEIHYTLDGTKPTKDSAKYTGPFTIDENCEVTAIAVKEGMADSEACVSCRFIKVAGLDEPSIRFGQDGKAHAVRENIPFADDSPKEYEYVLVPNYGAADDYNKVNVSGKVAVVQRGDLTFADKYRNAKNAGAIGLIIYNNQSGIFGADLGNMSNEEKTIPLLCTTWEAGLAALNNTKDNIHGTLWIDSQQPGFKAKVCNLRHFTGKGELLTGRVKFTALCGEGDSVTMDAGVVLSHQDGVVPSAYSDELKKFEHWSCSDPNVSLTEGTGYNTSYDRELHFRIMTFS